MYVFYMSSMAYLFIFLTVSFDKCKLYNFKEVQFGPQFKKLGASLVAQTVKRLPAMWETRVQSQGQEDPLEKEMATHSRTLAWKIPWMEEPDGLHSMGSQRVGPRLNDFTFFSLRNFLPEGHKDVLLCYLQNIHCLTCCIQMGGLLELILLYIYISGQGIKILFLLI